MDASIKSAPHKRGISRRARDIPNYLDTLDGFRAAATIMVLLFHYWQQSWVGVSWNVQLGAHTFNISLEPWITSGSLGVEILFLLSGFCLFYPLAMNPNRPFNAREFAYKRFVRIMPSYYLCFLVGALLYMGCTPWASLRSYQMSDREWWYHFIGGLFFGETATPRMFTNPFNGVLWSLPIEMEFYLLFPLILRAFKKRPTLVMVCAFVVGESWRFYLRSVDSSNIVFLMNQLPGMIDVFVGGMYSAWLTGRIKHALDEKQLKSLAPVFTMLTIGFVMFFWLDQMLMNASRSAPGGTAVAQMNLRKYNIIALGLAVMSSAFSNGWLRLIFGNPFTRFISTISYQLYMWHMLVALRFKEWHIPPYTIPEGQSYPMNDEAWRWPYFMISLVVSLIVATLLTYCFERPVSRALTRRKPAFVSRGGSSLAAQILIPVAGVCMYLLLVTVLNSIL